MKIINYNYGYKPEFACSMHGRILVTPEENKQILDLLLAWKPSASYAHLKQLALSAYKEQGRYNVRVNATEYLAENMPHAGKLKRGNYYIEVRERMGMPKQKYYLVYVITQYDGLEWLQRVVTTAFDEDEARKKVGAEDWTHENDIEVQEIIRVEEITQEEYAVLRKYITTL